MTELDWSRWPNFSRAEMQCKCGCGRADMDPDFMDKLQALRTHLGFAFHITSGFRCPDHDAEAHKRVPCVHAEGIAADIACSHEHAAAIAGEWKNFGFTGKGERQEGAVAKRFIHLDTSETKFERPRPHVWSY